MSTHVFTSAAANYIPKARVLARSIKRFHPDLQVHLVLIDAVPERLHLQEEPFDRLWTIGDLGIDLPAQWAFKHSLVELSTAVKGPALLRLLETPGCSEVIYFDPDIVVLRSLDGLLGELRAAPVLLTPHFAEPAQSPEAILDNEISALRHGIYNLGFLGLRNCEEGRRFARWWSARLLDFCYDDIPRGLFTDQRWADLAPAYFPGCRILRDPTYNVCTWNLSQRTVEGRLESGLRVGDEPIVFYHFSGFDSGAQKAMLEKYGARMRGLHELRSWYEAECERMGQREFAALPWHYGYFDNGEPVSDDHRRLYREREDLQKFFLNPFSTSDRSRSFYHWYVSNHEPRTAPAEDGESSATQGRLRMLVQQARSLWKKSPEYRIFLSATEGDAAYTGAAARAILEKNPHTSGLFLIGARSLVEEAFADPQVRERFQGVSLPQGATHAQAFREVFRLFPDMGFLFVKASTVISPNWDIRLVWSLAGRAGVATISPMCDREPFTALNLADCSQAGALKLSVEDADRLCASLSKPEHPEIARCLEECVYVSPAAVRATRSYLADPTSGAEDGFGQFHKAMRDLRYSHVLADHIYVGSRSARGRGVPASAPATAPPSLLHLRRVLQTESVNAASVPPVTKLMMPRYLHVMHSWGGGLEWWVQEYCRADGAHHNFVLKSVGAPGTPGKYLYLYRHIDDVEPLRIWPLHPAIDSTVASHAGYAEILSEIIDEFGIERILVSSLIGHSLDVLREDPRTVMVCHDYYPFCPALNVTFGQTLCVRCGEDDLAECTRSNPHHRFFPNVSTAHWLGLRGDFARRIQENRVLMIAPTPSVTENYARLLPESSGKFRIIPHGTPPLSGVPLRPGGDPGQRLRVVIPGSLAPNKGLFLFRRIIDELASFADVHLIGCGEWGEEFQRSCASQVPRYEREELPQLLARIRPDVGLLLSVVAETYSYILQELFELGIPPLATRTGSFGDRIENGVNGFLCEPAPADLLGQLRKLAGDRASLIRVHETLRRTPVRRPSEMLADYQKVLEGTEISAAGYFCPDARRSGPAMAQLMHFQLYWQSAGESYTEANSVRHDFPAARDRQRLTLRIPRLQRAPDQLRLDLSDEPGVLVLHRIELYDNQREGLWNWDGNPELFSGPGCSQISVLVSRRNGGVLLCMTGTDPQVIFPTERDQLASLRDGGSLELEVSGPPEGRELLLLAAESLIQNGAGLSDAQRERLAMRLAVLSPSEGRRGREIRHADRVAVELAEAQARIQDLENSWSWWLTSPLRASAAFLLRLSGGHSNRAARSARR